MAKTREGSGIQRFQKIDLRVCVESTGGQLARRTWRFGAEGGGGVRGVGVVQSPGLTEEGERYP